MRSLLFLAVGGLLISAAPALAAGINYNENWDSYAVGTDDPTYNAVWTPYAPIQLNYVSIQAANAFSAPNSVVIDPRDRAIVNPLNDGITNGTLAGTEMGLGEYVVPGGPLGDPLNLNLGYYMSHANNTQRRFIASYVSISSGGVQPPWGANALDPLPSPINVFALGKLNTKFTDSGGGNAENVGIYFFNGLQWVRTSAGTTTGYNRMWAEMFFDGGDNQWKVRIREELQGLIAGPYNLAFDPTVLGFDTISWTELNSGQNWSGGAAGDDVFLVGGTVVPEPMTMALLAIGLPFILRRRLVR
jgi:hypothetical protein